MEGRRFGQLIVLNRVGTDKFRCSTWKCRCDCGEEITTTGGRLRSGGAQSCGHTKVRIRHGHTSSQHGKSPEYTAYGNAKARCTNPKFWAWKHYGGRGIEFRFKSFEEFLSELGPRPSPKHSIDRIDNNGHYVPGNVRWATWEQQVQNKRKRNSL